MKNLRVPPLVNIPLSNSVDPYNCILRALPIEGHAFSTKARVPALMFFEVQEHSRGTDVATFLGCEIEKYSESEIVAPGMELINVHDNEELSDVDRYAGERGFDSPEDDTTIVEKMTSRLRDNIQLDSEETVWKDEGTGMLRLAEHNRTGTPVSELGSSDAVTPYQKQYSQQSLSSVDINPANTIIGESFAEKAERVRLKSPYGHLPGWKLDGLIAKSNDDVRQEVFVMQLITYYQNAFGDAKLPVWLFTYKILSTSKSTGLIQLIPNAISLDGLKKKERYPGSLLEYFKLTYGGPQKSTTVPSYKAAVSAFLSSMAGYSVVTYLLAIKDRYQSNVT
jgi:phosphatidylinositol 4-kinase